MSIFRKQAVDAYVDSDDRGDILGIVPLRLGALFAACVALAVAGVFLLLQGHARVIVRGRGVVLPVDGVVALRAPASGRLERALVHEGAEARRDELLFEVGSARIQVRAPVTGTIEDVAFAAGGTVREGETLATLVPSSTELRAYMLASQRHLGDLHAGRPVRLRFDAQGLPEITGTIRHTRDGLLSSTWRERFAAIDGAPVGATTLVEISLPDSRGAASGIRRGMAFTAELVVREQRLISLLFAPRDEP